MTNRAKVFRIKVYRKRSGPYECVVIATSRQKALAKASRKSAQAAKEFFSRLAHELTAPGLDKPDIEAVAGGRIYHMHKPAVGPSIYPKAWTAGAKLTKPSLATKGSDKVMGKPIITLLGFAPE